MASGSRKTSRSIPRSDLADGSVRRVGRWTVGVSRGEPFAVSSRCRHQLADLSAGSVDADGCLVCPWHGARYDVSDGRMVRGPHGFLAFHGRTKRYAALVVSYARFLPLRRGRATLRGDQVEVDPS
jgi:nitrite reductase/ring-hydroxylating ferredoxin subunit